VIFPAVNVKTGLMAVSKMQKLPIALNMAQPGPHVREE
jgi:hypothetical protein